MHMLHFAGIEIVPLLVARSFTALLLSFATTTPLSSRHHQHHIISPFNTPPNRLHFPPPLGLLSTGLASAALRSLFYSHSIYGPQNNRLHFIHERAEFASDYRGNNSLSLSLIAESSMNTRSADTMRGSRKSGPLSAASI